MLIRAVHPGVPGAPVLGLVILDNRDAIERVAVRGDLSKHGPAIWVTVVSATAPNTINHSSK